MSRISRCRKCCCAILVRWKPLKGLSPLLRPLRGVRATRRPRGPWACDERRKGAQRRAVAISTPLAASERRVAHRARAGARHRCVRAQKHFFLQSPI